MESTKALSGSRRLARRTASESRPAGIGQRAGSGDNVPIGAFTVAGAGMRCGARTLLAPWLAWLGAVRSRSPHGHGERWSSPARASAQLRLRARSPCRKSSWWGLPADDIEVSEGRGDTTGLGQYIRHVNTPRSFLAFLAPLGLPRQAAWLLPHTYAPPMAPPFPSAARAEVGGHAVRTRSLVPTSQHISNSSRHADLAG